ncbi:MAG: hypothetical protein QME42_08945 [bacterium]|nr:hypothetical protein [bacterium]
MLYCCEKCHKGNNCLRKWILGQKNLPQTCCVECQEFSNCLDANRRNRWEIVHGKDFVKSGNFTNSESEVVDSMSEVLDSVIENPQEPNPDGIRKTG